MRVVTVCGMGFGTSLMLLMSIKEIAKKYGVEVEGEAVDLVLDGGPARLGVASTVAALGADGAVTILRQGVVRL